MRIMPSLVFRSTLLMSFLIVVASLALTHGATLAKTNQVSGPAYVVIPAAQVNKLALPEITAAQVSAVVSEPLSAEAPAGQVSEFVVPDLTAVQVSALVSEPASAETPASQVSEFVVPDLTAVQVSALVSEPASAEIPAAQVSALASEPVSPEMPATQGCELNARYPESILQWCDLIVENANAHDLPPNLLAALIWLESGGNPGAYSASGAVGLMQVMPRDGLAASFMCVNGPCFASRPTIDELQDPEYNIEYGTRMLAGLYARSQDMREALKNYGPHDAGYSYADKVLGIYDRYGGE